MKKLDKLEQIFQDRIKEVGFLQLKEDTKAEIGDIIIDDELPLPVLQESLLKDIKDEASNEGVINLQEEIKLDYIVEGIIMLLGIDPDFKNNNIYNGILRASNDRIEEYIFYLGMKDFEEEKFLDAAIKFRCILQLNEQNQKALFNYALVVEILSDQKEDVDQDILNYSTRLFEQVLNIDDEFDLAYYKLGYHYKYLSQYLKASLMWEKFIEKSDDEVLIQSIREELISIEDEVNMESAFTYILYNDYDKALSYLEKLLPRHKDLWNVNMMLGKAYAGLGDFDLAKSYYETSMEKNPTNVDIYNELGILYINLGLYDESLEVFSKGINSIEGSDYKLYYNRGLVYTQIEDYNNALADFKEAKKLNPSNESIDNVIEEITNLM